MPPVQDGLAAFSLLLLEASLGQHLAEQRRQRLGVKIARGDEAAFDSRWRGDEHRPDVEIKAEVGEYVRDVAALVPGRSERKGDWRLLPCPFADGRASHLGEQALVGPLDEQHVALLVVDDEGMAV